MTVEYSASCTWIPLLWYLKVSLIIMAILGALVVIIVKLRFRKRWVNVTKFVVCSLVTLGILGYSFLLFTWGRPRYPSEKRINQTLNMVPLYISVPENLHYQVRMSRKDTTHYTAKMRGGTFKMTFVETWCGCCRSNREIEYCREGGREMKDIDEARGYLVGLGISSNLTSKLERKEEFYLAEETFKPGWHVGLRRFDPEEKITGKVDQWWDGSYELRLKRDGSVSLRIHGGYQP